MIAVSKFLPAIDHCADLPAPPQGLQKLVYARGKLDVAMCSNERDGLTTRPLPIPHQITSDHDGGSAAACPAVHEEFRRLL